MPSNTVKALGRSQTGSNLRTTRTSYRKWIRRTTSGRQREAQHTASGAHMLKTYVVGDSGAQAGNASVVVVLVRFHEHDRSPELGNASVVAILVRLHEHDKSQELGNVSVVWVLVRFHKHDESQALGNASVVRVLLLSQRSNTGHGFGKTSAVVVLVLFCILAPVAGCCRKSCRSPGSSWTSPLQLSPTFFLSIL